MVLFLASILCNSSAKMFLKLYIARFQWNIFNFHKIRNKMQWSYLCSFKFGQQMAGTWRGNLKNGSFFTNQSIKSMTSILYATVSLLKIFGLKKKRISLHYLVSSWYEDSYWWALQHTVRRQKMFNVNAQYGKGEFCSTFWMGTLSAWALKTN